MNDQRIQSWTSIVIAICGAVGIGLALYQNHETSALIESAADALKSFTYPVVKFQRYQWNASLPGVSCDNPAFGVNAYYRNVSGVPIAIEKAEVEPFMGDRPIAPGPAEITSGVSGEKILAPGEEGGAAFIAREFGDYYKRLKGQTTPPNLNFKLSVKYHSLVTGEKFCYTTTVISYDDCRLPQQARYSAGDDRIAPCPDL